MNYQPPHTTAQSTLSGDPILGRRKLPLWPYDHDRRDDRQTVIARDRRHPNGDPKELKFD